MVHSDIITAWDDFRAGDKKAFSFLYETYFDLLYRYGMKFVSDDHVVKDCIQDLFVKLYNNRESISSTSNPKFYLLFSLKNLILNYLTKYNRLTYLSPADMPFYSTYQYEEQDDSQEVDDDTKSKYDAVIKMLNPRQKEALYLRFQLELSYEEISGLLDINYQSARNLIHRTITKIRENIDFYFFIGFFLETFE